MKRKVSEDPKPPLRDVYQRTEQWLNDRRGCLNASQLAQPLGMYQRRDPQTREFDDSKRQAQFYCLREHGLDAPPSDTRSVKAMAHGTKNEDGALRTYQSLRGDPTPPCDVGSKTHPVHKWLRASCDGLVGDTGLVEVKCPYALHGHPHKTDYIQNGSYSNFWIPNAHLAQMNLQMEVTDRDWCDYMCATKYGVRIERVPRDTNLFQGLFAYYHEFYTASQDKSAEIPALTDDDRRVIRGLFDLHIVRCVEFARSSRDSNSYLGSRDTPGFNAEVS